MDTLERFIWRDGDLRRIPLTREIYQRMPLHLKRLYPRHVRRKYGKKSAEL